MKNITNEAFAKIQKILSIAFSKEEPMEISNNLLLGVMDDIRIMKPGPNISYPEHIQQWAWKLSPVTFAMLIFFLLMISQIDLVSNHDMAKLLLEDPIEYSLFAP